MRWTPASQIERSSLTHKNSRCVVAWSLQPMRWATESGKAMRNPGIVWLRKPGGSLGGLVRNLPWKEFQGLETSQTNQPPFFLRFESPLKRARPLQKMYPPFFWVEGGKGEFRLCRFASGIWTSWTSAGNWPVSPILPACWLSGSRKTSLLGTCSIWSWQQQNRAKWQAESKLSLQSIQGRRLLLVNGVITTAKGRK